MNGPLCDCGAIIPFERRQIIPGCKTCIKCASKDKKKPIAFSVYGHKTAPEFMIVPDNPEAIRQAIRANRRAR